MTTIRATCPQCGEVEMGSTDVVLRLERGRTEGLYTFVCPACGDKVEKPADKKVVMLLLSAGVEVREPAAAVMHPSRAPAGHLEGAPAFTLDDLIDLHFLLQTDDWFEELTSRNR